LLNKAWQKSHNNPRQRRQINILNYPEISHITSDEMKLILLPNPYPDPFYDIDYYLNGKNQKYIDFDKFFYLKFFSYT